MINETDPRTLTLNLNPYRSVTNNALSISRGSAKNPSVKPLIAGISGYTLTEQEKKFFNKNHVLGFILFRRNIKSQEQLISLTRELKSLYTKHSPIILIDQEGGKIATRLCPPIIDEVYEENAVFGAQYNKNKEAAIQGAREKYSSIMRYLNKFNIDSPCAPVADLNYPYTHEIIGDRSFGNNVNTVVELCSNVIEVISAHGGIPIMKHIPGHGRSKADSHLVLPRIDATLHELFDTDFEVFRQLSTIHKHCWAMTAHIVFDAIDHQLPITISPLAIKFIRNELGFNGVLISDALCMLALHGEIGAKYSSAKDALKADPNNDKLQGEVAALKRKFVNSMSNVSEKAFIAGCDILLHCSGDIEEISAVSSVLPKVELDTILRINK